MKSTQHDANLVHVQRLFGAGTLVGMAEGQLLEQSSSRRDEVAFEVLVARHGPMVLGVCRRVLSDPHDVEDAFQATFLVLVRKAHSLRRRDLLGNWLYGVAHRVAVRARAKSARRRTRERSGAEAAEEDSRDGDWSDLRPVLDEEIARLPEKYRAPVVLCFLEGQTHEEAAQQLRWPVGTLKSRLARARARLQGRLTRRGLAPSAGLLGASFSSKSSAAVGTALVRSTVKTAMRSAASPSMAGVVPASVASLTEGVLRIMAMTKLKTIAITLMGAGVVTAGATGLAFQAPGVQAEFEQTEGGPKPGDKEPGDGNNAFVKAFVEHRKDSTTGRPQAQSPQNAADELELLKAQLETKRAEVRKAEAQIDVAKALVARNTRLISRDPNYVSKEEQIKAESEVAVANSARDIKQTEVREVEIRIVQAMRRRGVFEGPTERSGPSASPASPAALEQKLREMDRKLDRLIDAVEGLARERVRPIPNGR